MVSPRKPGLSRFVDQEDGIAYDQALSMAELQLEVLHDSVVEDLEALLETIGALAPAGAGSPGEQEAATLYQLANEIYAVAGALQLKSLSEAALSMCQLLDLLIESRDWDAAAVALHLHTLRLLNPKVGPDVSQFSTVLSGLTKVVERVRLRTAARQGRAS